MMTATYKPMLFSGPMVRACLRDVDPKEMTRRIIKPLKIADHYGEPLWDAAWVDGKHPHQYLQVPYSGGTTQRYFSRIEPGDVIWAREAWQYEREGTGCPDDNGVLYRATDPGWDDNDTGLRWRPSRYMPRWACRLWLRVTAVRPERLQDITTADAIAEGMTPTWEGQSAPGVPHKSEIDQFADLWDSINAKRGHGWDTNPWVWVYTFERAARPEGWPG